MINAKIFEAIVELEHERANAQEWPPRIESIDPARAPSATVITRYSGGRIVSTETLDDVPPEIPVREYAPPRIPDLCPDDHDPQTCPDGCPICMSF